MVYVDVSVIVEGALPVITRSTLGLAIEVVGDMEHMALVPIIMMSHGTFGVLVFFIDK
jgi:hypothetical protein